MKWLALSVDQFEPIPDIQFSLKKPLIAASVVLTYARRGTNADAVVTARAELRAKIPIKGMIHYAIDAVSLPSSVVDSLRGILPFSFSEVREEDVSGGSVRLIRALGSSLVVSRTGRAEKTVEMSNESGAPILAHLQVLPAFQQTRDEAHSLYGGHIAVGSSVYAVRLERLSRGPVEAYDGRFARVPSALSEEAWAALPWKTKKVFGFDWDVAASTLTAARFHVPLFGQIQIKA